MKGKRYRTEDKICIFAGGGSGFFCRTLLSLIWFRRNFGLRTFLV